MTSPVLPLDPSISVGSVSKCIGGIFYVYFIKLHYVKFTCVTLPLLTTGAECCLKMHKCDGAIRWCDAGLMVSCPFYCY